MPNTKCFSPPGALQVESPGALWRFPPSGGGACGARARPLILRARTEGSPTMRTSRRVGAFVLVAGLALGLGGCRYYWFKPGTTQEAFNGDNEGCLQEGRVWAAQ